MAIAANFPTVRPSLLLDFSNQIVLDPRVTFARTTTAYYYDNKSAALAEQNLLLYSNTFTNAAWIPSNIGTPVLGATDPAGGATAYTFTASAGSNQHSLVNTAFLSLAASSNYTVSCYLQAGTNNFASLNVNNNGAVNFINVNFNLTTGVVAQTVTGGTYTSVSSSIVQIGSTAWYRCSITFNISVAASNVYVFISINNAATFTPAAFGSQVWTALGTETLLAYGAQLEQHTGATVYTATTATVVDTYTPTLQSAAINSPRFDYNPTTRESLGLLLEQASTNNQLYSSNFDNAAWTKTQTSITTAADISPDGTQNAQLMTLSTTSAAHTLVSAAFAGYVASTTYTVSIYAKAYGATSRYITFGATRGSNDLIGALCNFDLVGGTAGTALIGSASYIASATSNIQSVGNGWYRCSMTYTTSSSGGYIINMFVVASNTATTSTTFPSFAGNGFDGYLLWGAQYEIAPSATSYIATVASAQTRTVDAASMTGTNFTSWYNYSGGTVYVEAASGNPTAAATPYAFTISDNTTNNQIAVYYTAVGVQTFAKANNVSLQTLNVALPSAAVANTFYKTAWYYSNLTTVGNGVSSVGQTATTYATAINVPAVTQINFATSGSANLINGRIKKFAYYPAVLTNTQIQSLSAN